VTSSVRDGAGGLDVLVVDGREVAVEDGGDEMAAWVGF